MPRNLLEVGINLRDRFSRGLDRAFGNVRRFRRRVTQQFQSIGRSVFNVRTAIASLGAGLVVRDIIRTASSFEQLRAQIKTVEGSADAAADAFARIQEFATTTPFALQSAVKSFITLRTVGLEATDERLRAFGDIAAAFGRDITEFAEAVRGAVTGEMDRLKAFGVVAKLEGDKVRLIFDGTERTIDRNAKSIASALEEIARTRFGGAMAEQLNTIKGSFSLVGDAADKFQDQVGRAGLNASLIELAGTLTRVIEGSESLAKSLGRGLAGVVQRITAFLETLNEPRVRSAVQEALVDGFKDLGRVLEVLLPTIGETFDGILGGLQKIQEARESLLLSLALTGTAEKLGQDTGDIGAAGIAAGISARRIAKLRRELSDLKIDLPDLSSAIRDIGEKSEAAGRKAIDRLNEALGTPDLSAVGPSPDVVAPFEKSFFADFPDVMGKARDAVADFRDGFTIMVDRGIDGTIRLVEKLRSVPVELKRVRTFSEGVTEGFKGIRRAASAFELGRRAASDLAFSLERNLTDGIVAFIDGTKSAAEAFRDMTRSIISDLIRIGVQMAVIRGLASVFGGPLALAVPAQSGLSVQSAQSGLSGIVKAPPTGAGAFLPVRFHGRERVDVTPLTGPARASEAPSKGGDTFNTTVVIQALDAKTADQAVLESIARNGARVARMNARQFRENPSLVRSFR